MPGFLFGGKCGFAAEIFFYGFRKEKKKDVKLKL